MSFIFVLSLCLYENRRGICFRSLSFGIIIVIVSLTIFVIGIVIVYLTFFIIDIVIVIFCLTIFLIDYVVVIIVVITYLFSNPSLQFFFSIPIIGEVTKIIRFGLGTYIGLKTK